MEKKFDQPLYKSPEDKSKDSALENAEKSPEAVDRLAAINDQVANILRQEIEAQNLSFDDLLAQYRIAAEKYNYQEKGKASELLRQISDYNILCGGDYDERLKEEFKKRYEALSYSGRSQDIFIEEINNSDLEVGAKLLVDPKFSSKSKLLEKIGNSDGAIKKIYELTQDDLKVVSLIVEMAKNPVLEIEILKDVVKNINEIKDNEEKNKKLGDYSLSSIRRHIAENLIQNNDQDAVLRLIDEGYLEVASLHSFFHEVDDDQFLYDLAGRSKSSREVEYLFKFIADKEIFSEIIKYNGQTLVGLSKLKRGNIVDLAKKFLGALSQDPEIYQAGHLEKENKFIVGIPSEKDALFIAWSNTDKHEYHKDIFKSLSEHSGQNFSNILRSGGWVEVQREEGNKFKVRFYNSSGDFGNYSYRVLAKFKDNIIKVLQDKLGSQDVELEINISS